MTAQQLKAKYKELYDLMAVSGKTEYMMLFGSVLNEIMYWLIDNKTEAAAELIDRLSAIEWCNFLTQKEAENIVNSMKPNAPWTRQVWDNALTSLNIEKEEKPYYNSCALWVTMNMIYSDSAESIAMIMGKPLAAVGAEQMVRATHSLALDKLKDHDKVFNIRSYFAHVLFSEHETK